MNDPYRPPQTAINAGPATSADSGAELFSNLPKACPRCGKSVKKPLKFSKTRKEKFRQAMIVLAAIGVGITSTVVQIFVLHIFSIWLAIIPGILVSAAGMKANRRLPKLGLMRCTACRWEEQYLIQVGNRR